MQDIAHQITITLDDADFAAMKQKAVAHDMSSEALVQRKIALDRIRATRLRVLDPVLEAMFLAGEIENIPTGEPDSPEETVLSATLFNNSRSGKPLSGMVIEDRGPR